MQCSHHRLLITSQRLSFIHNTPSPLKALTWQDNLMSYIISYTSSSLCHPILSQPRWWWLPFPNTPELHKFVGGNPRTCENNNYWLTISLLPSPAAEDPFLGKALLKTSGLAEFSGYIYRVVHQKCNNNQIWYLTCKTCKEELTRSQGLVLPHLVE